MSELQLRKNYKVKSYNYRPPWIVQKGGLIISLFFMLVICALGFIRFPDVIPATAEITSLNPPVNLVAKVNSRIARILVRDGQKVGQEEPLVLLESSAKWEDVKRLEGYLEKINTELNNANLNTLPSSELFKKDLQLGEMQSTYAQLLVSYNLLYLYYQLNLKKQEIKAQKLHYVSQNNYHTQLLKKKAYLINS